MGMLRLRPRTLALRAVHRQRAASASASPPSRLQQGSFGGVPISKLIKPLSTLAQAANLRVSTGHLTLGGGGLTIGGGLGIGGGLRIGGGLGIGHKPRTLVRVRKRRLSARKKATEVESMVAAMASLCQVFRVGGSGVVCRRYL